MSILIQAGNTVRFTCKFYGVNGMPTNPTTVRLTLYDYHYNQISVFDITEANRLDVGSYFYDYTTASEEKKYIFEWYGLIDGLPSIRRDTFTTFFL